MIYMDLGLKISAFIISTGCSLMAFHSRRMCTSHWTGYLMMCIDIAISSVIASIITGFERAGAPYSDLLVFPLEGVYDIIHCLIGFLLLYYVMQLLGLKLMQNRPLVFFMTIPYLVLVVEIILNYGNKQLFYYADDLIHWGPNWNILVIVPLFYFLLTMAILIAYARALPRYSRGLIIETYVIAALGTLVQTFLAIVKIELFADSLSCLILLLTLENVDRIEADTYGVFNRETLIDECRRLMILHLDGALIDIRLRSVRSRQGTFAFLDDGQRELLTREVSKTLLTLCPARQVFAYDSLHFVVLIPSESRKEEIPLTAFRDQLGITMNVGGILVEVLPVLTRILIPSDVKDMDTLNAYLSEDLKSVCGSTTGDDPEKNLYHMQRSYRMEQAIRRAVDQDSMDIACQPILSGKTMKPVYLEVFLRLHDPVIGDVPPSEIIPIAERDGLISWIGKQTLAKCCRLVQENDLRGKGFEGINLNLSNYQLLDESMVRDFIQIVEEYRLPPSYFALEFTEDEFARQNTAIVSMMEKLREAGFILIIDNFGSSSTNIIQIIRRNINGIKVDRRVLWNAITDENRCMLLRTMIVVLKKNGKTVYQTGIETDAEMRFALDSGCDFLQGYRFRQPLASKEFIGSLSQEEDLRHHAGTAEGGSV